MSAHDTFEFAPHYTLRPASSQDHDLAALWTQADPFHRDTTPADFWIEQRHGRDAYLLSDPTGPVFFLKLHRLSATSIELHIQFPPEESREEIARVCLGLIDGLEWLEGMLKHAGIQAISFDSHNATLMRFATKRLGFTKTNDYELVKAI